MRRSLQVQMSVLALLAATSYPSATAELRSSELQQPDCPPVCPSTKPIRWDFNGDGYKDLVVGVPGEDTHIEAAGAVQVLYGGTGGITASGNEFIAHTTQPAIPIADFDLVLGSGDFNGDGYSDLAVAARDSVTVLYGSASGLSGWKQQELTEQSSPRWPDCFEFPNSDEFGIALAAGDFNQDSRDDLAIGCGESGGGSVIVVAGSADGLTVAGSKVWTQDTPGVPGTAEAWDGFGYQLLAGDFGNGPADDLVIAAVNDRVFTPDRASVRAGAVHVLYGSATGLTVAGTQRFVEGGVLNASPEEGNSLGRKMVGGDFNADDFLDLLITSFAPEGHVLYGGPTGLVPSTTHLLGTAVGPSTDFAAGNFGAKGCVGCDDLAVSRWPGEVVVIYGSTTGLAGPTEVWTTANGIPGVDLDLPATLAAHNFGKGSHSDLAIRVKSELPAGAGAVAVMYGDSTGLSATGAQLWHQWSTGIQGTPEPHDQFGSILGK